MSRAPYPRYLGCRVPLTPGIWVVAYLYGCLQTVLPPVTHVDGKKTLSPLYLAVMGRKRANCIRIDANLRLPLENFPPRPKGPVRRLLEGHRLLAIAA